MEIELKYRIDNRKIADLIWEDELFAEMEEKDSREELCLDAKYFDTLDCCLANNEIAYRIRCEGDRLVAALKWQGQSEDGLHTRKEINVPVIDDNSDPSVFDESDIGKEVIRLLEGKSVSCLVETKFSRKRFRIDTGTGIFELSIDMGKIITQYGEEPISEVEIELFTGETEELEELGKSLKEKYDLQPEDNSKYARGINMVKRNRK